MDEESDDALPLEVCGERNGRRQRGRQRERLQGADAQAWADEGADMREKEPPAAANDEEEEAEEAMDSTN